MAVKQSRKQNMQSTGCSKCVEHELKPIRYQSGTYPRLLSLINRVDELSLMAAHDRQDARKASGIDGVTKSEYDERLLDNVFDLVKRMKSYSYVLNFQPSLLSRSRRPEFWVVFLVVSIQGRS